MRDLAGAVGIQQSGIYNHFASKQKLLVDLMVGHMERVLHEMQTAVADQPNPVEKLKAFARFHVTNHIDYPDDVFLAYMELRSLEDPGRAEVLRLRDAYETVLRDILSDGMQAGDFNLDRTDIATRALLAMLTGVTVWYKTDGKLGREDVAETYIQLALQSVGGPYLT